MPRITITANDSGFFMFSPIGGALAPNVFLRTGINIDGTVLSFDGFGWTSADSLRYAQQDIFLSTTDIDIPEAQLGQTRMVTVTSIDYSRVVEGETIGFGRLELPEPLHLTAILQSYGVDDVPAWFLDLGTALKNILKIDGFDFIGGDGDDFFAPHAEMLPFRGMARIKGGAGDDNLTGTLGSDKIKGGTGNDIIYDPDGSNKLRGGAGNDIIEVGNGSDGSYLHGGSGDDTLISGWGDDFLKGGSGADILIGGRGDDSLKGNRGSDTLDGGSGDDILVGGRGRDILTGGSGEDVFVFNALNDGRDIITDFENGQDIIQIFGLSGFDSLQFTQSGTDLWVESASGNGRITLVDTDIAVIDISDFSFV